MEIAMAGILLPVLILIVVFTFVILNKIIKAFASRSASRQELAEVKSALAQIQGDIAEVRTQLADVIISLHDRV